jgi:uncharacterized protein YcaQ
LTSELAFVYNIFNFGRKEFIIMKKLSITKEQARRFLLAYQGLGPSFDLDGKSGILSYIRRVGCIQFDPLNIVGHNQELILQSRIADFQPEMLHELLYRGRQLLDGWDKNMSIYSTQDWPYFYRIREAAKLDERNSAPAILTILPEVRREIEEQGPLSSADLDYEQKVDWPWAPTRLSRAVLESMYFQGELVIYNKTRTRKIYDLANRHLSAELLQAPDPNQTEEQYHDWYVQRRIGGIGLLWNKAGDAWLGISGIKSKERSAAIHRLIEQEKILKVGVEGIAVPFYMRLGDKPYLDKVLQSESAPTRAAIIAPLDNLLWDRRLVKELFDFDYRWEVYKPVSERTYGYYVLPVLYGNRFVARFEPGRDKKSGALVIKNWWWEPEVSSSENICKGLKDCFHRFTAYLGTKNFRIGRKLVKDKGLEWLEI